MSTRTISSEVAGAPLETSVRSHRCGTRARAGSIVHLITRHWNHANSLNKLRVTRGNCTAVLMRSNQLVARKLKHQFRQMNHLKNKDYKERKYGKYEMDQEIHERVGAK